MCLPSLLLLHTCCKHQVASEKIDYKKPYKNNFKIIDFSVKTNWRIASLCNQWTTVSSTFPPSTLPPFTFSFFIITSVYLASLYILYHSLFVCHIFSVYLALSIFVCLCCLVVCLPYLRLAMFIIYHHCFSLVIYCYRSVSIYMCLSIYGIVIFIACL